MSEHIARVFNKDMDRLREWLKRPNGSFIVDSGQLVIDAVEDGGILVRTRKWRMGDNS